jgi:hypothetical protein
MTFNLNIDLEYKLHKLVETIYKTIEIEYVYIIKNGKKIKFYNKYKNLNCNCECDYDCHNNCDYICECESDICNGVIDCHFQGKIGTSKKIYYVFKYLPCIENELVSFGDNGNDFENIYLECDKIINLNNKKGINHDTRGADETKLVLDFHDKFTLKPINGKIPLKKLINACFRIKSHKFDFWYELYCDLKCKKHSDRYEVYVRFDHGS